MTIAASARRALCGRERRSVTTNYFESQRESMLRSSKQSSMTAPFIHTTRAVVLQRMNTSSAGQPR
jgi:hypothetical protein